MILRIFSLCSLFISGLTFFAAQNPSYSQTKNGPTPEQVKAQEQAKALYKQHQAEFDYLLGDWEFTLENKQRGKARGFWSAVRLAEGAQVLDEYRVVGDKGETYYASSTVRSYNAKLDRWELVSADAGNGLQNFGTAQRVGEEMHIEQKFGSSLWRIRYYDIKPDSFSWAADRSLDGGKTWETDYQKIEAHRIGPARSLGQLAPYRNPPDKTN